MAVVETIDQVISMVAEKLGVATEKVYPMLLAQAKVFTCTYETKLWIGAIALALMIILMVVFIICSNHYSDTAEIVGCISIGGIFVSGIVLIVCAFLLICDYTAYFTALHNPEWWAIEYVTKLLT